MHSKLLLAMLTIIILMNPLRNYCEASSKNSRTVATISISSGVLIGGTALFFLLRKNRQEHAQATTVIAYVDSLWKQSNSSYYGGKCLEAAIIVKQIQSAWNPYLDACATVKRQPTINKESLSAIIHQCALLEKLKPSIDALTQITAPLPQDQEQLLTWNRHDLLAVLTTIRSRINDTIKVYNNNKDIVNELYRPFVSFTNRIDSLFKVVYNNERLDFSLKNRFYYNRMVEENNPISLQRFVEDCNYYNVDKEWCEQARLAMNSQYTSSTVLNPDAGKASSLSKKPTEIDIMNEAYTKATTSKNVELLEEYIKKYSNRKFNILKKAAQLDNARLVLRSVQKEILLEQMFSREHPRFSESSATQCAIKITGVSQNAEIEIRKAIESLQSEFSSITAMRFPASLSIDYSSTPPLFLLTGYIHGTKDITTTDSLGNRQYTIQGAQGGFSLIDKLARYCTIALTNTGTIATYSPAYAVRFIKSGGSYLTMYGAGELNQSIHYYNFYDISVPGHQNIRIPYTPNNFTISLNQNSDSLQLQLGDVFFGK